MTGQDHVTGKVYECFASNDPCLKLGQCLRLQPNLLVEGKLLRRDAEEMVPGMLTSYDVNDRDDLWRCMYVLSL